MIYLDFVFFCTKIIHPMAIFKMEISMVIEEICCHGWETGQSLLEILPQSEQNLLRQGHITKKRQENKYLP